MPMKDRLEKRHRIDYLKYVHDMCERFPDIQKDWEEFYLKYRYMIKSPKDYFKKRKIRSKQRIAKWFVQKRGVKLIWSSYDITAQDELAAVWSDL